MDKRPKIKPVLTTADKLLNIIALLLVLSLWVLVLYRYNMLPDNIANHIGTTRNLNNNVSMSTIFKLPAIGTSLFIIFSLLNRFPHLFNYPLPITEKNAAKNYALATRTIRMLNVIFVLSILLMYYNASVSAPQSQVGKWLQLLIMLVGPFIAVAYSLIRFNRVNKIR